MPKNNLYILLRFSIAFIWLWTGIVSLWLYPVEGSLELLAPIGITAPAGIWLIYLVAGFEILMALAMFANLWVRQLAALQILMVVTFTVILTLFLPQQWLHPFGPVSKNIPLLAATAILYHWEGERKLKRLNLYAFHDEI